MFTPLHRELGQASGDLSWDMLEKAIELEISETADLDFKQTLPFVNAQWQDEFAKDIAAQANGGGGLLIFGLAETRGRGTAREIVPVDMSEQDRLEMQRVAFSKVHPPVVGLKFHSIIDPVGLGTVVAVSIPGSVDAPHLVLRNHYFGAPVRNDASTIWMNERQIEAAYESRFAGREFRTKKLNELYADTVEDLDLRNNVWVVAVARPIMPMTRVLRIVAGEAQEVAGLGSRTARVLRETGYGLLDNLVDLVPRPGLRRWTWSYPSTNALQSGRKQARMEVHFDGSLTAALQVGGLERGWEDALHHVGATRIEAFLGDFASMMRATATKFGIQADYALRTGLAWEQPNIVYVRPQDPQMPGSFLAADLGMRRFRPVESELFLSGSFAALADSLLEHGLDVINQAGIRYPHILRTGQAVNKAIR
ncbi:ATP-binding protein [Arthrobacter sp. StoSoilB5]|uniref:ATP-binding protein n=1 Tax=Arthrobacter sp. StoSoilB5 TaxID=2830992 RepID=UPI001CC3F822|nr:ATP-binding protein [Arthrobacter sp. StoSoilB5]BCW44658.1 hypothetical protein StoSoilB5_18420 [Arthrobacter sp. StoSoilB5]